MARLYARPVSVQALNQFPLLQEQLWAEAKVNGGMVTSIDPADIPEAALALAKNTRIRYDKTSRRFGYRPFSFGDTDTNAALKLALWKQNNGSVFLVKLRPQGPRYYDFSNWIAPTGTALLGAATDRFDFTIAQNLFIFTNNGVDFIQQLVTGAPGTFSRLGNAPKARFVTGFYNRVIAANYTDPAAGTPVTIGWSGDLNPTVWDTASDLSAGSSPLVDSPSDTSDYITHVVGFTNMMVIMRERSIWLATKQPIGSSPFYFFGAVAGIGCNCPHSIAVMPNGLVWVDLITGTVWAYTIGGQPDRIGLPIEKLLVEGITDQNQVFGTYNPTSKEYIVGVVQASTNVRRVWRYNFISKAWSYDELSDISEVYACNDILVSGLTVQQLVGTVAQLQGTVAGLSATKTVASNELIGKLDGSIYLEDITSDSDSFGTYLTECQSKDVVFP